MLFPLSNINTVSALGSYFHAHHFSSFTGDCEEMLIQEETERPGPLAQEHTSYIGAFLSISSQPTFIIEAKEFGLPKNFPLEHKVEL